MRLVSLLPSATEIIYALGLDSQLVGVTFECDEPAGARVDKTVVVGGVDTRGMTPREIDDYVRGRLAQVTDRVAGQPRPKVAVAEWVDPPFTARRARPRPGLARRR